MNPLETAAEALHRNRREQDEARQQRAREFAALRESTMLPANRAALEQEAARRSVTPEQREARGREAAAAAAERARERNAAITEWQALRERIIREAAEADQGVRGALERGDLDQVVALRLRARELRAVVARGGEFDQIMRSKFEQVGFPLVVS